LCVFLHKEINSIPISFYFNRNYLEKKKPPLQIQEMIWLMIMTEDEIEISIPNNVKGRKNGGKKG